MGKNEPVLALRMMHSGKMSVMWLWVLIALGGREINPYRSEVWGGPNMGSS